MVVNQSYAKGEPLILSTPGIGSAEPLFGKPLMADGARALTRLTASWNFRRSRRISTQES
jgi:hypothetical protein